MNFGLNKYAGAECEPPSTARQVGQLARPRTLREQLQDQIAHHKAKIADLEEACGALTPDVEKALNALQKL